jgi:hypothetical protein
MQAKETDQTDLQGWESSPHLHLQMFFVEKNDSLRFCSGKIWKGL